MTESQTGGAAVPGTDTASGSAQDATRPDTDSVIAVIGVAARFGERPDGAPGPRWPAGAADGRPVDAHAFDHRFFGVSPREAVVLDPQQRVLLECAYHALEDAGADPADKEAVIGVYAGGSTTGHAALLRRHADLLPHVDDRQVRAATGADFLASRVAYKLGLNGPAVSTQAGAATVVVALHTAVQALLGGECDVALAGSVAVPGAPGAPGAGCAVLVLKPLAAAVEDGDRIHAVVAGTALGTRGALESTEDCAARLASVSLRLAGLAPDAVAAVRAAGGHDVTDTAPAAAALVEALLGLGEQARTGALGPAAADQGYAAVDVAGPFGVHAHVLLGPGPAPLGSGVAEPDSFSWQLLPFSARTPDALAAVRAGLGLHFEQDGEVRGPGLGVELRDAAWTLQSGRGAHPYRDFVVAQDAAEAAEALTSGNARTERRSSGGTPQVVFTFPGHGGQHLGMARGLLRADARFRRDLRECAERVRGEADVDLLAVLDPEGPEAEGAAQLALENGAVAQLAVFVLEFCLARAYQRHGVRPAAVVGHSLGAYAAACVAGVFSFADGVRMVVRRIELLLSLAPGAMAAVRLSEAELLPLLPHGVGIAAFSGPEQMTVSGPRDAVTAFVEEHAAKGLETRLLEIPGAGHSSLVDPVVDAYADFLSSVTFRAPVIPVISDTTGTWADPEEIVTPGYWCRHMRHAVRYHDVLETLHALKGSVLLEVGPGATLTSLARRHAELRAEHLTVQSLPHPKDPAPDVKVLLSALGALWTAGVEVRWPALHEGGSAPRRTGLPGYPFERTSFPPPGAQ
ncbi:acyltransferase domain-containing protein [Streptomyces rubiginosohelvolus]|uniref:acyltransferase domain-containing protein n=2 Tax=Streptomyces TaxID=1883 RepID=UPI00367E72D8